MMEVYNIYSDMEPVNINLDDWTRFGEGGNGQSYYHKTDDTVMLKLNDTSWSKEKVLAEFNLSKTVHALGVKSPEVFEFVTDGERFGYTAQRIKGKKSFSRMIADDPSRIPELAALFAARSREFHSTPCDTTAFQSALVRRKEMIDNCDAIPDDVRARLESIFKGFDQDACTCLHGDFHPGNLIAGEGGEYWIDLGGFAYGDPMFDISSMYMIGHYIPVKALENLFHISRRTFCRFLDEFLKCYYGEELTAEKMEWIKKAAVFRTGLSIASNPKSALVFVPLIRGQKIKFALLSFIVRLAWPLLHKDA